MMRLICWLVGHRLADASRPFSHRMGICRRCGKITAAIKYMTLTPAERERCRRDHAAMTAIEADIRRAFVVPPEYLRQLRAERTATAGEREWRALMQGGWDPASPEEVR